MSTQIPKHDSVIDFTLSQVKDAIDKFVKVNLGSDFYLNDKNEIFGNYTFSIFKNNKWNGLSSGSMHVNISHITDSKTKITVETLNNGNSEYVNIRDLIDAQNDFLKSLSNILQGNEDINSIKVSKGEGCLGILLLFISLIMGYIYFY